MFKFQYLSATDERNAVVWNQAVLFDENSSKSNLSRYSCMRFALFSDIFLRRPKLDFHDFYRSLLRQPSSNIFALEWLTWSSNDPTNFSDVDFQISDISAMKVWFLPRASICLRHEISFISSYNFTNLHGIRGSI